MRPDSTSATDQRLRVLRGLHLGLPNYWYPIARASDLGATPWQLYWKVLLPAIVPSVLAGMRLGIVFCLLGVLVVEMFAGVRGMGYVMGSLANGFQAPELFAATALVSATSIAIVLGLDQLNERLSRWRG